MKNFILCSLCLLLNAKVFSQPDNFSWNDRHNGLGESYNYVTGAKHQWINGLCVTFSAIAAVEAATQAYFNCDVQDYEINLSEQEAFSDCITGVNQNNPATFSILFNFIKQTGIYSSF